MKYPGTTHTLIAAMIMSVVALLLSGGCTDNVAWCETIPVNEAGWSDMETIEFALQPSDSMIWMGDDRYDATLSLRYTDRCRENEVRLLLERESLDSICRPDTILVTLFNKDGTPAQDRQPNELKERFYQGEGLSLGIYEKQIELLHHSRIEPMYRVALTPLGTTPLTGISNVTMIISR
ncbi:MAG: hypothetical protein K2M03_00710 [Muribaculaceae bacterium]|nr:hypothetical protein [Muribaculaceae bacterium]